MDSFFDLEMKKIHGAQGGIAKEGAIMIEILRTRVEFRHP